MFKREMTPVVQKAVSAATYKSQQLKQIKFYQTLVDERTPIGFLIYAGEQEPKIGNI